MMRCVCLVDAQLLLELRRCRDTQLRLEQVTAWLRLEQIFPFDWWTKVQAMAANTTPEQKSSPASEI